MEPVDSNKVSKSSSDEVDVVKLKPLRTKMEAISIRYGEHVTIPVDVGDATAVNATIYIGKPGEVYIIEKTIALTGGAGTFVLTSADTQIPLDTYYYQINVEDGDGYIEKYPSPDPSCDISESNFPRFIVNEALDETEVS